MTCYRVHAMIACAAAAAFSGATALSAPAHAAAPDRYAVIAYSTATGATGWANNASTMEEAAHIALGNCQLRGDGCTVASWARNGCVALAVGSGRWGADWGLTAATAENAALAKVPSGRIIEVHCTG